MSLFNVSSGYTSTWKNSEKLVIKFLFIYFIILSVPLDWKYYISLFSIDWTGLNFYDLFTLSKYVPVFFGLDGYASLIIPVFLAAIGAIIWQRSKEPDYDSLYYWLRVIVRYRLAIGIIAYGFIKLFPLQMPYPSLSNLHTNYGDFYAWKIYFHTVGIAQWYESFLGFVEILAGVLLLFRRTVTFGSGIIIGFTGNVFAANLAYDAGEQVYSLYLVILAAFLFAYDAPRLYSLLIRERYTIANKFQPTFNSKNIKNIRIALKAFIAVFLLVLGATTYANYTKEPYKLPKTTGLSGSYGYYNVREFKLNNQLIPYSRTDSNRWQNVVFEKWATISIKIAKPITLDRSTAEGYYSNDIDRNYESAGVGGRRYFSYDADTVKKKLYLVNKNKNHSEEKFELNYQFLNDSTIVLSGVNEKKDSVHAVLDKVNRKYMLYEGRRKPVRL
ncbi:DoxX family protein [Pseudopedobacter sp.]|uniref:DoxX family protein n=1 Tax=Pseudopedobacter sp. TaxID=1936787 RepID=UPI0033418FDB